VTQKWQREIEEILREKFQGDELSQMIEKFNELIKAAETVDIPSGSMAEILGPLLKSASEELYPLAAVYAGFQLGVAYERLKARGGADDG